MSLPKVDGLAINNHQSDARPLINYKALHRSPRVSADRIFWMNTVLQKATFSEIVPLAARGMVHSCGQNWKPFSSAAHIKFEHHRRTIANGIANHQQLYVFPWSRSCHYTMPARPRIFEKNDKLTNPSIHPHLSNNEFN